MSQCTILYNKTNKSFKRISSFRLFEHQPIRSVYSQSLLMVAHYPDHSVWRVHRLEVWHVEMSHSETNLFHFSMTRFVLSFIRLWTNKRGGCRWSEAALVSLKLLLFHWSTNVCRSLTKFLHINDEEQPVWEIIFSCEARDSVTMDAPQVSGLTGGRDWSSVSTTSAWGNVLRPCSASTAMEDCCLPPSLSLKLVCVPVSTKNTIKQAGIKENS